MKKYHNCIIDESKAKPDESFPITVRGNFLCYFNSRRKTRKKMKKFFPARSFISINHRRISFLFLSWQKEFVFLLSLSGNQLEISGLNKKQILTTQTRMECFFSFPSPSGWQTSKSYLNKYVDDAMEAKRTKRGRIFVKGYRMRKLTLLFFKQNLWFWCN